MKVIWTRPALRALAAIGDHIARHNRAAALRIVQRIRQQVRQLERHPHLGRPGRVHGTRELVVTNTPFVVPYRVRDESIEVLTVFHGARRWPESFD